MTTIQPDHCRYLEVIRGLANKLGKVAFLLNIWAMRKWGDLGVEVISNGQIVL